MIFVDTSFWVALRLRRDDHHAQSVALMRAYGDQPLITSSHVRGETWTFLRRRAGHASAVEFLDAVERSPRVQVRPVEDALERDAWRWLRTHDEREYSFVERRASPSCAPCAPPTRWPSTATSAPPAFGRCGQKSESRSQGSLTTDPAGRELRTVLRNVILAA